MNVTTISKKISLMIFFERPTQMVESSLILIINRNSQLMNVLDSSNNRPLIRKYSNIPFTI